MRAVLALTAGMALLSACAPAPYDNATPGGYSSYEVERAQREAALTGAPAGTFTGTSGAPLVAAPLAVPPAPTAPAVPPVPGGIAASELAAAGIGVGPAQAAGFGVPPAIGALPAPAAPAPGATLGLPVLPSATDPAAITDPAAAAPPGANPFSVPPSIGLGTGSTPVPVVPPLLPGVPQAPTTAPIGAAPVSGPVAGGTAVAGAAPLPEWSPDADPLRASGLEASPANAAPQIVAATNLAALPGSSGPNIVDYALAAPNAVGQEFYSRFVFAGQGRAARNCARYPSPDEAQRDFLARGGPERDPRGLDPDGDGFACAWDPTPFRAAAGR